MTSDPRELPISDDSVEGVVEACLARYEAEGWDGIEAVLAAHPGTEAVVRASLANLQKLGVIDGRDEASTPPRRFGDFELLDRIGGGGMGVVYRARQISLDRIVALKIIRPEALLFEGAASRFAREVSAVSRLKHPNIVPIHVVGEAEGVPYFAMDLVEGVSLAEVIRRVGGRSPESLHGDDLDAFPADSDRSESVTRVERQGSWVEAILRLLRKVALALEHAHRRGVIHRDVKPSNIAVTPTGEAMLLDFGIAFLAGESSITRTGQQPGSLHYMSPEQVRGHTDVGVSTDVYSLGVTLYEALALRRPFEGDNPTAVARAIETGVHRPIRSLNRAVPKDVELVCRTAMGLDPAHRYVSMGRFRRDIENLLAVRPIEARPGSWYRRFTLLARRRPVPVTLAAGLFLIVIGGLAWNLERSWSEGRDVDRLLSEARGREAEGRLDEALAKTGEALGIRGDHVEALRLRTRLLEASERRDRDDADQIRRLSDVKRYRDLVEEYADLWPALPELAARLEDWDARAGRLTSTLEVHRASLARLDGLPADESTAWRRSILEELIAGLETRLPRIRTDMAARRDNAAHVAVERDSSARRDAWRRFFEDVKDDPRHRGLSATVQQDLTPLHRNESGHWEFLHFPSGAAPVKSPDGRTRVTDETGIVFILVPGAIARTGSVPTPRSHPRPFGDPWSRGNEGLNEPVRLDPYLLSKYEVTQGQWSRTVGHNPSSAQAPSNDVDGRHPVERVSWIAAGEFCRRFSFALPTDVQWEHACRAGTTTIFFTGNEPGGLQGFANIMDRTNLSQRGNSMSFSGVSVLPDERDMIDDGWNEHAPVGTFGANPWGFHDMIGNVWEWTRESLADVGPPREGDGFMGSTDPQRRASRGGGYASPFWIARSATRSSNAEDGENPSQGFRPARAWR